MPPTTSIMSTDSVKAFSQWAMMACTDVRLKERDKQIYDPEQKLCNENGTVIVKNKLAIHKTQNFQHQNFV